MTRLLFAAACLLALTAEAKLKVVATLTDLGALAREAGGDQVEVATLAKSTQDPHFVDPRHSLVLDVARADLLLHVGMELEGGWLPTLLTSSRNGKVQPGSPGNLNCSSFVKPIEVATGKLERSMGDLHPGGNPHYSKDPRNAVLLVKGIAARLSELDPERAQAYAQNAAAFEQRMSAKISGWEAQLRPFKGAPMISFHRSWSYFTTWAGLEQVAFMEPKPGLPPVSTHVAQVLLTARQKKARIILQEDWYSEQTSQLVASKSGARLVKVPGNVREGQRYEEYMDALVKAVAAGLGGGSP